MKKGLFTLFLTFVLVLLASIPLTAFADTYDAIYPRLIDQNERLTEKEEFELSEKLNEISERQQFDVVIATIFDFEGKTAEEYADYYYDYYQFGFGENKDGILLLVGINDDNWHITAKGYGKVAMTDAGLEHMRKLIADDLSKGNYYDCFTTFAELCDDYITEAKNGTPYDAGHLPSGKFNVVTVLIISMAVLLIGAIVVVVIKKSKKAQND